MPYQQTETCRYFLPPVLGKLHTPPVPFFCGVFVSAPGIIDLGLEFTQLQISVIKLAF